MGEIPSSFHAPEEHGDSRVEKIEPQSPLAEALHNTRKPETIAALGQENLAKLFLKDNRSDLDHFSGTADFSGDRERFSRVVGMRHLVPKKYDYVEVIAPDGSKRISTSRDATGNFFDSNGYIQIWDGYQINASIENKTEPQPESQKPTQKPSEVPLNQTTLFGDSITVSMLAHLPESHIPQHTFREKIGSDGKRRTVEIGASVVGQGSGRTLEAFRQALKSGELAGVKKIVVGASVNDVISKRNTSDVIRNLTALFTEARAAGLQVAAYTTPYWDPERYVSYRKSRSPSYSDDPERMKKQTDEINGWLLTQQGQLIDKVVDMHTETADSKKYIRAKDGVHFTNSSAKRMAELLV